MEEWPGSLFLKPALRSWTGQALVLFINWGPRAYNQGIADLEGTFPWPCSKIWTMSSPPTPTPSRSLEGHDPSTCPCWGCGPHTFSGLCCLDCFVGFTTHVPEIPPVLVAQKESHVNLSYLLHVSQPFFHIYRREHNTNLTQLNPVVQRIKIKHLVT